jgi:SAM-dependent methyltransferase
MNEVFGPAYAGFYDLLYGDKDYDAECDVLERAFSEFAHGPVRRVLDLGCGTGGHAIRLAQRGYGVIGIDRSAAMLGRAQEKAIAAGVADQVAFHRSDLTAQPLLEPCDAVVMMFAVLGYLVDQSDQIAALSQARRNVRSGGVLVFDAWYAPAVEHEPPGQRWRVVENGHRLSVRLSEGKLEPSTETCDISFRVLDIEAGSVVADVRELHRMRYYRTETVQHLLHATGFELVRLGRFPEFWRDAGNDSWSVSGIARAV